MSAGSSHLRRALPFLGSAAILSFLATRVDLHQVAAAVDGRSLVILGAALLVYGAVSLLLEAAALSRVLPAGALTLGTAARIKAASYLLSVLHYTVGLGALSVLLKRRAGTELGRAAGVVLLLSALDLAILILLCIGAVTGSDAGPAAVRLPVVGGVVVALAVGFVLVRTPRSLGPLERIRTLSIFAALAETPLSRLVETAGLRLLFVASFISLVQAALLAFEIVVPVQDLVVGVAISSLLAVLPIAFAGLGTGQAAFLYVFREHADPETLLASSLLLSVGIIGLRAGIGALFAREFAREARELAE